MPLKGVRYRYAPNGVRLAFRGNTVVEAKNTKTGKTHTPAEFAADRKRRKKKMPTHGSGELTPLGQRVLSGYMDKWGGKDGHDKFETACRKGLISKDKMFKNPEKAKV